MGKTLLLVALILLPAFVPAVLGDLDVNTVTGIVTLDGEPAPGGTVVSVYDTSKGLTFTTSVDGAMIPFFLRGEGRYDTGDVPSFDTGDDVVVSVRGAQGSSRTRLRAGTTTVNVVATSASPPTIVALPEQRGVEDVPWTFDLSPYIRDDDTPLTSMAVGLDTKYATVHGLEIEFLYPEGVTQELVMMTVSDGSHTATAVLSVRITPVNDPPSLSKLPDVIIKQGGSASMNLASKVSDPDHDLAEIRWGFSGGEPISGWFEGSILFIRAPLNWSGSTTGWVLATDPGGLVGNATLGITVETDYSLLIPPLLERIEELEELLDSAIEERDQARSESAELLRGIQALSNRTADLENLLGEARLEAQLLRLEIGEERGESVAVELALREEMANLTSRIDLREEEISDLGQRLADLTLEHAVVAELARQREEQLNQTIASLESVVEERAILMADLEENNTELLVRIAALLAREQDLRRDIESLEGERSALSSKLLNITESLELLEAEEATQEATIAGLRGELERLRVARLELEKELEEKADEVVSVSRSAKAREDTIEAMHRKSVRDMEIALGIVIAVAIPATWAAFRLGKRRWRAPPARSTRGLARPRSRWRPHLGLGMGSVASSVRFNTRWRPRFRFGWRGWIGALPRQASAPFRFLTRAWKCRARARRRALARLRARAWRRERSRLRAQVRSGTVPGRQASPRHGPPSRRKAYWRYALRPRKIAGMAIRGGCILRSPVPRSQRTGRRSRWGSWQNRFPDAMLLRSSSRRGRLGARAEGLRGKQDLSLVRR